MFSMLKTLEEHGLEIHFLHVQRMPFDRDAMIRWFGNRYHEIRFRSEPVSRRLTLWHKIRKRFLPEESEHNTWIDDWYSSAVDEEIDVIGRQVQPDIVLAEYVFFSKALLLFEPSVLKVIDTHDRFANRFRLFQSHGVKPAWLSAFPDDEIRCLDRADRVIAIQQGDAKYFGRRLGAKVHTVGHTSEVRTISQPDFSRQLLFVGGFNAINVDALNYFLNDILPRIREQYPDAELLVVGDLAETAPEAPGVRKVGFVENLDDAYALARIVVNPCRFGTGLKTKNVEAMAYGRALVTTSHGAEGLEAAIGRALLVADSADEFVRALFQLFADPTQVDELGRQGQRFVTDWNTKQDEALRQVFNI